MTTAWWSARIDTIGSGRSAQARADEWGDGQAGRPWATQIVEALESSPLSLFARRSGRVTRSLYAAMALILLVGAIPSSVDADDERQTRKKIVFWNLFTGGSSHEVVTELVARFNHRQQEYVVEQVDVPGGHITAKILPTVAGGVPLDESHVDQQEYGGNPDTDGRQASWH